MVYINCNVNTFVNNLITISYMYCKVARLLQLQYLRYILLKTYEGIKECPMWSSG